MRLDSPNELPVLWIVCSVLLELRIHLAVLDQLAAHLHDDGHVLDRYRADLDAGHAGAAGPQGLHGYLSRRLAVHVELGLRAAMFRTRASCWRIRASDRITSRGDSGAPTARGRTGFVAAAALGAGVQVQQLLPGEVGDVLHARLWLLRGLARQTLRGQRIAKHQRAHGREDVLDLGDRESAR